MEEYEKATKQVIEAFFEDIPELIAIRELVQSQIDISPHFLFFGNALVLITRAVSKLSKSKDNDIRISSGHLLHKILLFLDACLQHEEEILAQTNDSYTFYKSTKVQASVNFAENLYKSDDEYTFITNLAPARLRAELDRVEKYFGISEASEQELYYKLYEMLWEIITKNSRSPRN